MYSTWLRLHRAHVVHKQVALASPDSTYLWVRRKLLKERFWMTLSPIWNCGDEGLMPRSAKSCCCLHANYCTYSASCMVFQVDDPIAKSELFLTPAFALTSLVTRSSLGLSSKGDSKHSLALSGRLFGFNGKTLALGKNCHASELCISF